MKVLHAAVLVISLAIKPLGKSKDVWGWAEFLQPLVVLAGWGAAAGVGIWQVPWSGFVILGVVPSLLLLAAAIRLQLQLDSYEAPQLEFVFDPARYPSCRMAHPNGRVQYRVGVRPIASRSVEEVRVEVTDVQPPPESWYHALPLVLHPKDAAGSVTFTANPYVENYVDVIDGLRGESRSILVYYAGVFDFQQGLLRLETYLPPDTHRLRLRATGRDVRPCEEDFVVSITESEELLFHASGVAE